MTPPPRLVDLVLADLAAESEALDLLVSDLDDAGWSTPTPAPGWDVAHQIAHLAWTDDAATAAAVDKEGWDEVVLSALEDPEGFVDSTAAAGAGVGPAALLTRWRGSRADLAEALRSHPEGEKLPWFGPPMSAASMATARFMETWAHALDVADGLGIAVEPTDRVRNVVHLGVRTRDFAYGLRGQAPPTQEFRIEVTAPSGDLWTYGPEDADQRVTGSAYDLARLVTQRVHRDDTDLVAIGGDANTWLSIAQAFAGPPGAGRERRG